MRWPLLKPLLEDASILKIGQNLKYDCLVLRRHGIELAPLDDTMLLSYALDGGRGQHGMDALAERHLGHACMPFTQVLEHAPGARKSDKTFAQVPLDKATEYAAEDADVTLRLWMVLKPRLAAERMTTVYETLERPLVAVLADMERAGVKVDTVDPVAAHLHVRPAHRPARGGDLRAGGPQVQPGLAQAARRVPVRQLETAGRPQDQDRPVGDARQSARRSGRPRGPARAARAS